MSRKDGFGWFNLHIDGASRGNPGDAAAGIVIEDPAGEVIEESGRYLGQRTNNFAEYSALVLGLEKALEQGAERVRCYSDSELLVRQLSGDYRVKSHNIMPLFFRAIRLIQNLEKFEIKHIPGTENHRPHKQAQQILKAIAKKRREQNSEQAG